ncbi:MAG TPA: ABC transporter permease [bacterium]|nr:ABC transporter permease [bacterium]
MIKRILINILAPLFAVILAFLVGAIVIVILGEDPIFVYRVLFSQSISKVDGWGYVLFNATPLIFSGLAVALAFRGGMFNIGVEGQIYIGAFACAWFGITFNFHPVIEIPLALIFAMVFGGLWGLIPGFLKAKFGAHEVINTIMLNFIAIALTSYLVNNPFKESGQINPIPQTRELYSGAIIPRVYPLFNKLGINLSQSVPLNYSFFIALFFCVIVWYILEKTKLGYEIKAVGLNPRASRYGGINPNYIMVLTMFLSGALGGLAGINDVMGYRHRFLDGFSHGIGFTGIAVALLGKNNPIGIVFASILFGILDRGALAMDVFTHTPRELIKVLQAVIIIFVAIGNEIIFRLLMRLEREEE